VNRYSDVRSLLTIEPTVTQIMDRLNQL